MNNEQQIALVYIKNPGYHKLPGGGMEDGESVEETLKRELREEIGCEVKVLEEVGRIIEYRDLKGQIIESYCWITQVLGELQEPQLTPDEKEKGLEIQWMGAEKALQMLQGESPEHYFGKFIHVRELAFLNEAKRILGQ
ncbi:MAG: NUDIX domain-containing protein [Patescibacteria group bacterium]